MKKFIWAAVILSVIYLDLSVTQGILNYFVVGLVGENMKLGYTEMIKYQSPLFVIGSVKNLIWPVSAIAKEISKLFFKAQLIYIFGIVILVLSNFGKIVKSGVGAVRREKGEERGSARWASSKELKSVLAEGPGGTILGLNGQQPLFLPVDAKTLNQNILVIGSAGTRKSRSMMRPAIFQAVANGESVVVTDPKGELTRDCAGLLQDEGYEVKILNLVNIEKSDQFNPMAFVHTSQDALDLASALVDNSPSGEKGEGEQFWDDSMRSYYQALILYIVHELPDNQKHLGNLLELAARWGNDEEKLEQLFGSLEHQHPARRAYDLGFKVSSDKTRDGILISAASRIGLWQSLDVCSLTSGSEGIDIERIGQRKTAIFMILSDTKNTMRPISAMFFNQLFSILFKVADKNGGSLPIKVRIIADELANVGRITELDKRLSVTRSRGIGFVGVFQDLTQMRNIYPVYQSIRGNCDTMIFLGANDIETAEYISESLGDQTIETESTNESQQLRAMSKSQNEGRSKSTASRQLMAIDEILRMKNDQEVVLIRGQYPAMLKKYDYSMHTSVKKMRIIQIESWLFSQREEVDYIAPPEKSIKKNGTDFF